MNSLRACLMEAASAHAQKTAISFFRGRTLETEISYGTLNEDSSRLANRFKASGVKAGDRVILFLPKSLFFVVAHLAIQKIGAISVPLNPGFKKAEMTYFIRDADARLIVSGSEQEVMIKEIAPDTARLIIDTRKRYQDLGLLRDYSDSLTPVQTKGKDPGVIIYTSGTTGNPKGAILTQGNLVHDARNITTIWEITESDVLCHALPLFHIHGLCFALHTCLMAGSRILMIDQFSPEPVVDLLAQKDGPYACTLFMAVPSMYTRLMDYVGERKLDFGHMRLWTSGSAPLLPKDFERIKKVLDKEPVEREGMSETGMNFSNPIRGERKPGSIGLPLPGLGVRIVNPTTCQDVEKGEEGEIWLKGPSVTPGYWRKPLETSNAFQDGWFKTGDLGKVGQDGYFYLTDRLKHIIISGGENISPKEIEGVINQIKDVAESSVVGIPDEKWGEKVVAAVVTRYGASIKSGEIQAYCREYLHDWKCPKEVVFLKELPKNTMGKVLKEEVKRVFLKTGP